VTVALQAGWGADVENAYFLKFISAATGGTVENFSDRFTLKSMTGVFPQTVTQGLRSVTGTDGPDTVNNIQAPQAGDTGNTAPAAGESAFDVPYTMQTDPVRYAPMPPMAQTQITAKNPSPQWPTSAYTVYQKIAGTPNAITTNTLPLTFSVSSREATVCSPIELTRPYTDSHRLLRLANQPMLRYENSSTGGRIKLLRALYNPTHEIAWKMGVENSWSGNGVYWSDLHIIMNMSE